MIVWWRMARPLQLLSIVLVYTLGALMAQAMTEAFDSARFIGSLLVLLPVAVSVHYANEYADVETDALTARTPFSGGSGAFMQSNLPRRAVLIGAWIALIIGLVLALVGVVIGVLSAAAFALLILIVIGGWMYSLPPLKLAWRGWGELDNALLGGMILPLYAYAAQTGRIDAGALIACIPFTIFVFLNLLSTTWADRTADKAVGKFTLATLLPARRLRRIYLVVGLGALALLPVSLSPLIAAISLFVAPFFAWSALRYTHTDAPHAGVFAMIVLLATQMIGWMFA